ncbi:MAG: hypothetical protein K5767_02035 [Clostridia bacterium]|nr:hypothetical protein [Clostridia bacterium]
MYVYLFRFDSVRTSPEEIRSALEEMHRQILLYGNTVVLSYNQITDSMAFLAGIYNEQSYGAVMNLIRNGRIKMSRYAGAGTPSEYMQNAIKKYLDDETADTFRFSGLPTGTRAADLEEKRRDLKLVYEALRCSDPWLLRRESKRADVAGDAEAARRYVMLEHYVQMILMLSTREDTYIPERAAGENRPLTYYLDLFLESCEAGGDGTAEAGVTGVTGGKACAELAGPGAERSSSAPVGVEPGVLDRSIRIIREISREHDMLLSRSLWYRWLRERWEAAPDEETRRAVEFTEALIDICYNFTVERSITSVLGHEIGENGVADLISAIWRELSSYWKGFNTIHIPFCNRNLYAERMEAHRMYDESWETFDELRKVDLVISDNVAHPEDVTECGLPESLDRETLRRQHRRWVGSIVLGIFRNIGVAFAYILLFIGIQEVLGMAQSLFEMSVEETAAPLVRHVDMVTAVLGIIIFGIVSSMLSILGGVKDILDSIKQIGFAVRDLGYIAAAGRRERRRER